MQNTDDLFEQNHLKKVISFIDSEVIRLTSLIKTHRERVKAQGEKFNEDNPNGGMYAGMELTELHYEMENQMQAAENAKYDIWFYDKLKKSPYFARIDFMPDNAKTANSVYIGLKTLQEPETYDTLVCDWRAPISSLFYDDFDGKAYFNAPRGKIEGKIALKRQYKIEDGKLLYYVDSDIKIDDDILRDVLSSNTKEHLKVIVNSIQREQNKAIRYSDNKNLLVYGPAGSGKTSVGFHRLAYLLYRNRRELTSSEIVMFSNNDIFSSYVADIIPELGEMPINYSSFYNIFSAEIPDYSVSDYYTLAEALIKGNTLRKKSAAVKYSSEFINYMRVSAENYIPSFPNVTLFEDTVISADELLARYESDRENSASSRGERLISFMHAKIDEYFRVNAKAIYERIDAETSIDEATSKLVKIKRRELKHFSAENIRRAVGTNPVSVYLNILESYCKKMGSCGEVCDFTRDSIKKGVLEFEDALAVLYIKCVMGTAAILPSVKHVLIDEAQDLSLIQHEIIRLMFKGARYTLLADTNQAIVPEINSVDIDTLAGIYSAEKLYLNKSYRSTKQINTFALSLLPENEKYEIFERSGDKILKIRGEFLLSLKAEFQNFYALSTSTCIITKTTDEARRIYSLLKEECDALRLCDNKHAKFSSSPTVMPLVLTKGLEFDNVIVADCDGAFDGKKNQPYLYMAVTRALHRLSIITD